MLILTGYFSFSEVFSKVIEKQTKILYDYVIFSLEQRKGHEKEQTFGCSKSNHCTNTVHWDENGEYDLHCGP